jgi:hypothetical protein
LGLALRAGAVAVGEEPVGAAARAKKARVIFTARDAIYCTGCGSPVDIRKDHACPHCRAAFSLIDPEAVKKALEGYRVAAAPAAALSAPDLADALVMLERDRNRAQREQQRKRFSGEAEDSITGDLFAAGVAAVVGMLMGK